LTFYNVKNANTMSTKENIEVFGVHEIKLLFLYKHLFTSLNHETTQKTRQKKSQRFLNSAILMLTIEIRSYYIPLI
jgi:hypothetical protein